MPREPRIYIEKVLYLVTAKGHEDTDLFLDHEDFSGYLKSLAEYKREYGFKLFAYAILPKRLCLLIELQNDITISTIMHNLNSKYTKSYNSRYGRKGHLFQSRFKSKLIEKDEYLARLTRYIHMLPKEDKVTEDFSSYPYSSYSNYVYGHPMHTESESPELGKEISEVLKYLSDSGTDEEKRKAYDGYVKSADNEELKNVQKLLHRTAYVGSKKFTSTMRERVKNHIIEEERSKVVRKTNPVYASVGSVIILFLSVVTYSLYTGQTKLQDSLDLTANGLGTARDELAKRVSKLETEIGAYEEIENHGLGGFAWDLQLAPVEEGKKNQKFRDHLQFKGGKVISASLMARGFAPFEYTITRENKGNMIWRTTQTNADGLTVRWYGTITGNRMRGVLSERPASGKSRDFSFVSTMRTNNIGGAQYVVQ